MMQCLKVGQKEIQVEQVQVSIVLNVLILMAMIK